MRKKISSNDGNRVSVNRSNSYLSDKAFFLLTSLDKQINASLFSKRKSYLLEISNNIEGFTRVVVSSDISDLLIENVLSKYNNNLSKIIKTFIRNYYIENRDYNDYFERIHKKVVS